MRDLRQLVLDCAGLAPTWRLVELGATRKAIAWASSHDVIKRVRKGWYCLPDTPSLHQQAARVGGRLTEGSAARALGVWSPPGSSLHVALPPNSCRPRERDHYRIRLTERSLLPVDLHWDDDRSGGDPFVVPAAHWIRAIARSRPIAMVAAVVDSALRVGVLDRETWESIRLSLPSSQTSGLSVVDGLPEAGTESMVRAALHLVGVVARPQVWVTDSIRVDLLVGDRLVIEIHSQEWHGSREQRLRDLERTAVLTRLGYYVLVYDYWQVIDDLDGVVDAILAVVYSAGHLTRR